MTSGGAVNNYTSGIITTLLNNGKMQAQLDFYREKYQVSPVCFIHFTNWRRTFGCRVEWTLHAKLCLGSCILPLNSINQMEATLSGWCFQRVSMQPLSTSRCGTSTKYQEFQDRNFQLKTVQEIASASAPSFTDRVLSNREYGNSVEPPGSGSVMSRPPSEWWEWISSCALTS